MASILTQEELKMFMRCFAEWSSVIEFKKKIEAAKRAQAAQKKALVLVES
ncbi:hypothetical protein ACQZV8_17040 [Magnetococcales bacterium HHB-1]